MANSVIIKRRNMPAFPTSGIDFKRVSINLFMLGIALRLLSGFRTRSILNAFKFIYVETRSMILKYII